MNTIFSNFAFTLVPLLVGFNSSSYAEELVRQDIDARIPRFIIGGVPAGAKQFPYAVSLQRKVRNLVYWHACTFSLITTQSIIGAAHCVLKNDGVIEAVGNYIGVLGSTNHLNRNHTVTFSKFRVHRCYDSRKMQNDIAILIIASPVETGEFIKTIPLIGRNVNFVGKLGTIIGWGATQPYAIRPSRLLNYVRVDIVNVSVCGNYYRNLDERQICFGTEGKTGCKWDSGAPIKIRVRSAIHVLAGVNSFGSKPCAKYPNVGVSVSAYTNWIMRRVVGTPVFIN